MKLSLILIFIFFYSSGFADELVIPHYSIFLEGQLKCDDSTWKNQPWDKSIFNIWKLAYKTVSVVSDIDLKEVDRKLKNAKDKRKFRIFELKYKAYFRLICGEKIDLNVKGKDLYDLPVIIEAFERKGYLSLSSEVPPYTVEDYMNYSLTPFGGDGPKLKAAGLEGFSCLVKLDDFLADPFKKIDLNKLCEGVSKKKLEFTKREIDRVLKLLNEAKIGNIKKEN
jgi:hypothetical protein